VRRFQSVTLPLLSERLIDFVDPEESAPIRLPVRERVESGAKDGVLDDAAFDCFSKAVFRVSGAQCKSGAPLPGKRMIEQRCKPSEIVIGCD